MGAAAEYTVKECSDRRNNVDTDGHVYQHDVPSSDYNAYKEDAERDLDGHHRYQVSRLTHYDPLSELASSVIRSKRLAFVSLCNPSRLVTCVPPPFASMYSWALEKTLKII